MRPCTPFPSVPAPPAPSCAGQAAGGTGRCGGRERPKLVPGAKAESLGVLGDPGSLPGPGAAPWGHVPPLGSPPVGDPWLHPCQLRRVLTHALVVCSLPGDPSQEGGEEGAGEGAGHGGAASVARGVKGQPGSRVWAGLGNGVQSHGDTRGDRAGTFPGARQWLPKENGCQRTGGQGWVGVRVPTNVCHVCVPTPCSHPHCVCMSLWRVPCVHVPATCMVTSKCGTGPPQGSSVPPLAHTQGMPPGSAIAAEPCQPLLPDAAVLVKPSWQGWSSRAGRGPPQSGVTLLPLGLWRWQGLGFWGSPPPPHAGSQGKHSPLPTLLCPGCLGRGWAPVLGAPASLEPPQAIPANVPSNALGGEGCAPDPPWFWGLGQCCRRH